MRRLSRSILGPIVLAVLGAIGLLNVPAAAGTAAAERPVVFEGRAAATAARVLINTDPAAVPVQTLVDLQIPEASSVWDSSGTIEARASSVYPGATGTGGLQLLCDFSGGQCPDGFPPDYPFTAFASFPAQPEASTPTGFAQARATREGVSSTAHVDNLVDLSGIADLVVIGGVRARTSQSFAGDGTLIVESETAATDVVLGGGAVTVDLVAGVSEAHGQVDGGTATVAAAARLTIAGMRTAGGDVIVGDEGVTIGGQGTDGQVIDQINAALEQALAGTGVSARILGVESDGDEGQRAGARSLGLQLSAARALDGPSVPQLDRLYRTYLVGAVLGEAGSTVFVTADPFGIDIEIDAAPPPTAAAAPPASGGADAATGTGSFGTAVDGTRESSAPPAASAAGPPAAEVAPPQTADETGTAAVFELLEEPAALRQLYAILFAIATVWLVGGRMITRRLASDA